MKDNQPKRPKSGGVKTSEGKAISSLNAKKHGVLSHRVFEDEGEFYNVLLEKIIQENGAEAIVQKVIAERVAVHILQLQRISHARNEYFMQINNPEISVDKLSPGYDFKDVVEEGYEPEISPETMEKLLSLYHRYEVSVENRMYRALRELRENQITG